MRRASAITCLSEFLVSVKPMPSGHHCGTSPIRRVCNKIAHRVHNDSSRATVNTATEWEEVTLGPRSSKVVPKPARWSQPTPIIRTCKGERTTTHLISSSGVWYRILNRTSNPSSKTSWTSLNFPPLSGNPTSMRWYLSVAVACIFRLLFVL